MIKSLRLLHAQSLLIAAVLFTMVFSLAAPAAARADDAGPSATASLLPPLPDIYLSDLNWKDGATIGWGDIENIKKDKSTDGNTLTIMGQTYQKGIGTHATSKIEYDLLPNYKKFVAIVGIDDEVKSNPDSVKADIRFIVRIDDEVVGDSNVLKLDQTYAFHIDIPPGAKTLTLVSDRVDEITCDHADWVNAGFLVDDPEEPNPSGPSEPVYFKSPNAAVTGTVAKNSEGRLVYSVQFQGVPVIEESFLGVNVDANNIGNSVKLGVPLRSEPESQSYAWKGNHSTAIDHHTLTQIPVTHLPTGLEFTIEVKAYDDGIAFRYIIPEGEAERSIYGESTSFLLPEGSQVWHHANVTNYEAIYNKTAAEEVPAGTKMTFPLTVKLPDNLGYAAITEGNLVNYAGMSLIASGNRTFKAYFDNNGSMNPWKIAGQVVTPWRIISIASDLNGLVNSDIVPNTADPQSPIFDNNTDWIIPGSSVWSWLGGGGVTPQNSKLYIDYAAELGLKYNLVDDAWQDWGGSDIEQSYQLLKEVVDYGKARHVETWVWKHAERLYDKNERSDFLQKMHELGVAGIKVDFIDGETLTKVNFYKAVLEEAAALRLMVDFHGANKPTGLSRTYPNELTREGIYGLEQGALPSSHHTTLPFTRLLAGHGDYTPISFSGRLGKTSWSHQLATAITFTSPALFFGEHPEQMMKNPAIELIKSLPTVWDETIVLPGSEIGELSAFARRSGSTWYIAVMNGLDKERSMEIDLSYLDSGSYQAAIYADNPNEQASYEKVDKAVSKNDTLKFNMRASGGYVAKLSKMDMEPYGGGFLAKRTVYLKTAGTDSEVRYTLDGSEPSSQSPLYKNSIELTNSAVLRAKIVKGDGEGTELSAKFNKSTVPYLLIDYDGKRDWLNEEGKVRFLTNAGESVYEIRYTLDGSTPAPNSLLYTEPFVPDAAHANKVVIKARVFVNGIAQSETVSKTLFLFSNQLPEPPLPDIYLDQLDWVSAKSDWSTVKKNKSIDGNPLSVAGKKYEHGIGTHADSDIVYNIVEGAKRFVAVVGADDEIGDEKGGKASMIFRVFVDNQLLAESPIIEKGQYWYYNELLPEGAKQIRLNLDKYDINNSDHGDWVNAGFVIQSDVKVTKITVSGQGNVTTIPKLPGRLQMEAAVEPENATNKEVSWATSDEQIAVISQDGMLTAKASGQVTVTATARDGSGVSGSTTITILNSNAALSSVAVGGQPLAGFKPNQYDYEVVLPSGTSVVPEVAAAASDANAKIVITPATGLPGVTTIEVTAEDGVAKQMYRISFKLEGEEPQSREATLSSISVDGKPLSGFKPDQYDYEVVLPSGTTKVPEVAAAASNSKAKVVITPATGLPGVTTIEVTAEDGVAKQMYRISFKVTPQPYEPGPIWIPPVADEGSKKEGEVAVKPEQLAPREGKATVEVPAGTKTLKLPLHTAELLGEGMLEVKLDQQLTLTVPSEAIWQLADQWKAAGGADGALILQVTPLPEGDAQAMAAKIRSTLQADVRLASRIYDVSLYIVSSDGKRETLISYRPPFALRWELDEAVDPQLSGAYRIAEDGTLEEAPGTIGGKEGSAALNRPGKYGVLEITKRFDDVAPQYWAAPAIKSLAAKQIVTGTSATTFEPERSVTRAEFAALLVRALKLELKGGPELTFTDVKPGDWYAEAIAIAVQAGIVKGKSAEKFDPHAQITREEMVVMLMRAWELMEGKVSAGAVSTFADEGDISAWAAASVKAAAAQQLIKGRAAGMFAPQGTATRSEAAQVIYNLLNQVAF
ncbi:NPCBM/NEW2 domain-containing protein [Paenibacillus sp. GCM10027626]|uniref:NPCBM/NEW2 domain-containing protein n=1 Tax=Paenibacillus sp. GCM10027626 TaxID=3273411 RepID=UPI0036446EFB